MGLRRSVRFVNFDRVTLLLGAEVLTTNTTSKIVFGEYLVVRLFRIFLHSNIDEAKLAKDTGIRHCSREQIPKDSPGFLKADAVLSKISSQDETAPWVGGR